MPASVSKELADLARLAREGGLDLSPISLRVKADSLLSSPQPSRGDLAAFGEMAEALLPGIDEATALIPRASLPAGRGHAAAILTGLAAKGGAVLAELLGSQRGMPVPEVELENLVETGDEAMRAALAVRSDLTAQAVIKLVADEQSRAGPRPDRQSQSAPMPRAAIDSLIARARIEPGLSAGPAGAPRPVQSRTRAALPACRGRTAPRDPRIADGPRSAASQRQAPGPRPGLRRWARPRRRGSRRCVCCHRRTSRRRRAALANAIAADTPRDLAALALTASGTTVEEATRFLIRLGDDAAPLGRAHLRGGRADALGEARDRLPPGDAYRRHDGDGHRSGAASISRRWTRADAGARRPCPAGGAAGDVGSPRQDRSEARTRLSRFASIGSVSSRRVAAADRRPGSRSRRARDRRRSAARATRSSIARGSASSRSWKRRSPSSSASACGAGP